MEIQLINQILINQSKEVGVEKSYIIIKDIIMWIIGISKIRNNSNNNNNINLDNNRLTQFNKILLIKKAINGQQDRDCKNFPVKNKIKNRVI